MKYSDYIETNQEFQTSVNLEYDLNKLDKIKGYIPTEQSISVLGEFLKSFYYSTDTQNRANVLIGPYGRGKSHLLLLLTALTSMDIYPSSEYTSKEAEKQLKDLCKRISIVNKEIGSLAKSVVESKIRTLPVIVNSNSRDINQSFLMALNNALVSSGLENLLPKTYFDSAYDVIKKWENEIPEAYKKFESELKKYKSTPEEICIGLKQFNNEAYDSFCKVYPNIAAGMTFNPLVNMDVVKLYLSVTDALCEQTAYSGINIIFDEFSKFLESNLEKSQMFNLKIIQDLAEACSRSGKKQIHFTCITHKDILEYSTSDSFKTVEGRFSKIYFVASSEQSYELISNAIIKKETFKTFIKGHKKEMEEVINTTSQANVFREMTENDFEKKVVYGCFPMAPLTVYSLLKISELVGQNERTLFTYLASKGKNTLGQFIKKNHSELSFVTVDSIYDYFEDLFKKELFNTSIHSFWAKSDSAIKQLNDENQIRIIKCVAIINMINDGSLKTIPVHIKAALLMNDETFDKACAELQKNHIMTQRDSSEFVMLTANGVDVQRSINNQIESKALRVNICEELNKRCDLGYIIPHGHNDRNGLLRSFKKVFIEADTFVKYKNAQQIFNDYQYDGVVFYIIDDSSEINQKVNEKIFSFKRDPHIVVCTSDLPFYGEEILRRIVAAEQIKEKAINDNDTHYVEEIEYFEEDLQKQIDGTIDNMFSPTSEHSAYFNCEGDMGINRNALLTSRISDICDSVYKYTPVVNNEMVNKRLLSSPITKGRDIVVNWLLSHLDDDKIPCMDGYGPEVSIFKSAIQFTGLDCANISNNDGLNKVLEEIRSFVTGCENIKGDFKSLYGKLESKPYGMRRGIIPIFISYILRQYQESIILYHFDDEVLLSEKVLGNLNDNPENYSLLLETGTQDKEEYLSELETIFDDNSSDMMGGLNHVYSIMRNMQIWYRSLPEYTKRFTVYLESGENKRIEEYVKALRGDLSKYDLNARETILVKWVQILSSSGNYIECLCKIRDFKYLLDQHTKNFRNELSELLIALFAPGYKGELPKAVQAWYRKIPDNTKKHIFDSNTNILLSIAQNVSTYNQNDFLDELVTAIEALAIEDWNDNNAELFISHISDSIKKISEYRYDNHGEDTECSVKIQMPGINVEKSFSSEDITPLGKTALSNLSSVFDEYNDSLEPDEKLAIIASLIGKIIQ